MRKFVPNTKGDKVKVGLHLFITFHPNVKIENGEWVDSTIYLAGQNDNIHHPADYSNDTGGNLETDKGLCWSMDHSMSRMLAETGHTLISAGAFVFDDDDDYLSGDEIDQDRLKLQWVQQQQVLEATR
ncbi:hypothetical protein RRG08_053888 [Elysia crispata]|uniref:Uncharacterized protein n=1 Tax=Elysia crispata TaxID=231223 RepID=A0AAE0ZMI9_9GAST|nr:hypothetical protein RRG08_053888 [Elysia crispata]